MSLSSRWAKSLFFNTLNANFDGFSLTWMWKSKGGLFGCLAYASFSLRVELWSVLPFSFILLFNLFSLCRYLHYSWMFIQITLYLIVSMLLLHLSGWKLLLAYVIVFLGQHSYIFFSSLCEDVAPFFLLASWFCKFTLNGAWFHDCWTDTWLHDTKECSIT